MIFKCGYCNTFCLVYALAGFVEVSGAGNNLKSVCPGDSVDAFQNITFNNCSSVVSIYIMGEIDTLIARWSFENCRRNETLLPDYKERVFLYGNGTVSMHNVHPWDEARYIVTWQMGNIYMEDVVQIIVMAAPAKDCIPTIFRGGNSLFATLNARFCGKPVSTLYWKGNGDVPNTYEPVLKLNPGNQDGTHYACIEGPALKCVRNAMDYCSNITTGDKSPPTPLETWDVKDAIFIVVGIVLGISLILAIAAILIRKCCSKKTSSQLKRAVVNRRANGNARLTLSENEGRTEGIEVNDRNSEPGSSRAIIESEDQSDDVHNGHFVPLMRLNQQRPTHDGNLTEDECQNWLDNHPGCMKKNFGNLTGEQIQQDVRKWLADHPEYIKEYLDMLSGQHAVPSEKQYELCKIQLVTSENTVPLKKKNELWIQHFGSEKSQQKQQLTVIDSSENAGTSRELQTKE